MYTRRLIVEEVENSADQISLEEARAIKDSYQMGDIVGDGRDAAQFPARRCPDR